LPVSFPVQIIYRIVSR